MQDPRICRVAFVGTCGMTAEQANAFEGIQGVEFIAPHRRWEMRPLEKAIFQNAGERSLNEVPLSEADKAFKPGFRLQAERVVGAWQGKETGAATIDDALKSTELVARIFGIADR